MKSNWILTSTILGIIGGVITFFLTGNWKIALICAIFILIIVQLHNPKTRYFRAFYILVFPLLSNIYFTIDSQTENFDIGAGIKELDLITTLILGFLSALCLILDYFERNGKLTGTFLEIKKNSTKQVYGSNISIHQTINQQDKTRDA